MIHWGVHCQSRFICQFWCTGIQGIYALFIGVGSIWPKYVHLPILVYWYSRHLCSITLGGPLAKVCLSAKFGVAVFKASILDSLGVSIGQSRFICQILCTGIQGIYALFIGLGPSAKVGSSAKFGVLVFKASILDSLGVYCQNMFIC